MAANINEMKRMFENMYGLTANSLDAALPANQTINAQFNQIAQGLEAVRATTGTVNVPYFYRRDDEDPEQWITQFNAAFTASGRAEGNNGVNKAALAHLQGNALDWYHMIQQGNVNHLIEWTNNNDDANLKGKLITRFLNDTVRERKMEELERIRQLPGETVENYVRRFKKI